MRKTSLIKFNHNNGVVCVLKMSDAIGDKVRTDRSDVASKSCPRQDMRESIRYKIEEKGGSRVSLSKAPAISKKITDLPINRHSCLSSHDQVHKTVNHRTIETISKEDLAKEILPH